MKRTVILTILALSGLGWAQGVRSLGMGGVTLPGPWAAPLNPAYTAFPADPGHTPGTPLPLGLLNLVLRPETNPFTFFTNRTSFKNNFDALAFYDQVSRPYEFLINPARSPNEVVFELSADGVRLTDGDGTPLSLEFTSAPSHGPSTALTPPPFLRFPVPLGLPGLELELGLFASGGGLRFTPSEALKTALAQGRFAPNATYTLDGTAQAQAGVNLGLSYAAALPPIPGFSGDVAWGTRLQGFYGLGMIDATVTAQTTTDANSIPSATEFTTSAFYAYPGAGFGYGLRADLGLAVRTEQAELGVGVLNAVGFVQWSGVRAEVAPDGTLTEQPEVRTVSGAAPYVFANAAYRIPVAEASTVLVGADLGFGETIQGHAGLEYALGPFRLRGGIGWEEAFRFGVGAGYQANGVSLDAALTTHRAPLTGDPVYGVAVSLGFGL